MCNTNAKAVTKKAYENKVITIFEVLKQSILPENCKCEKINTEHWLKTRIKD